MAKELTTDYPAMRAAIFQKYDLTDEPWSADFNWGGRPAASLRFDRHGLTVTYRITSGGVSSSVEDRVDFDWTYPAYGGRRIWFRCPRCGKRCGILYLGHRVACRKCFDLAYPCEMQSRMDRGWALHGRWLSRIDGGKPKRMHWSTFDNLRAKVDKRALARVQPLLQSWKRQGLQI